MEQICPSKDAWWKEPSRSQCSTQDWLTMARISCMVGWGGKGEENTWEAEPMIWLHLNCWITNSSLLLPHSSWNLPCTQRTSGSFNTQRSAIQHRACNCPHITDAVWKIMLYPFCRYGSLLAGYDFSPPIFWNTLVFSIWVLAETSIGQFFVLFYPGCSQSKTNIHSVRSWTEIPPMQIIKTKTAN